MIKVFFIDPNSYNNLGIYDYSLLRGIKNSELSFLGSYLYNCPSINGFVPLFKYNKMSNSLRKGVSYCSSLLKLMRQIMHVKPEIIHIQWLRQLSIDTWLLKWMQRQGCKVILTAHNVLPHNSGDKYKTQYAKYYNLVDHIIVHTDKSKFELIKEFDLNPNKISVIFHGVLDYGLNESGIKNSMKQLTEDFQLSGKTVFGIYGEQSYYKGTDIIVDVWANTPELRDNPNCVLILGGKNAGVNYEKIQAFSNVIVIDQRISDDDFNALLRLTSVLLLPYRTISQSGLLFSGIANSTPILVSDAGGLAEPLKFAKIGWEIGTATFENLQKKMKDLILNPYEINFIKNDVNSFKKVQSVYSWENIAKQTDSLYHKLCK